MERERQELERIEHEKHEVERSERERTVESRPDDDTSQQYGLFFICVFISIY